MFNRRLATRASADLIHVVSLTSLNPGGEAVPNIWFIMSVPEYKWSRPTAVMLSTRGKPKSKTAYYSFSWIDAVKCDVLLHASRRICVPSNSHPVGRHGGYGKLCTERACRPRHDVSRGGHWCNASSSQRGHGS